MKARVRNLIYSIIIALSGVMVHAMNEQTSFVVVIASYKNIKWYQKNLDSLMMQDNTYSNWRAIYIDDCSPDGTGQAVQDYVHERGYDHKITVICNKRRVGAMANLYSAITSCADYEVVCILDGDDWIVRDDLFCILRDLYADGNVWLTWGQYREYPEPKLGICLDMPQWVIENNLFRSVTWATSHMRTFYAGLFKKIKKEDLMVNGEFLSVSCDLATMFPMLEMAGSHIKFNPVVVYEYNMDNPINDFKKDLDLIFRTERYIRQLPRYEALERLF